MYPMRNPVRHYAWGSTTQIPALLGIRPDGRPYAELWFSAYEGESSLVGLDDGERRLCDVVTDRGLGRLPFLAKVLAVDAPLSLQLHPAGDHHCKPELVYALGPCLSLCGLRPPGEVERLLGELAIPELRDVAAAVHPSHAESMRDAVRTLLLTPAGQAAPLVARVRAAMRRRPEAGWRRIAQAVEALGSRHPDDPAAVAPLLMNVVTLEAGQTLFVAADTPHTHLSGLMFEVQANSDAVVRAGLTAKPVDIPAFLAALDTRSGAPAVPARLVDGEQVYAPPGADFTLGVVRTADGRLPKVPGAQLLVCLGGRFELRDFEGAAQLERGASVFLPDGDPPVCASGAGLLMRVAGARAG